MAPPSPTATLGCDVTTHPRPPRVLGCDVTTQVPLLPSSPSFLPFGTERTGSWVVTSQPKTLPSYRDPPGSWVVTSQQDPAILQRPSRDLGCDVTTDPACVPVGRTEAAGQEGACKRVFWRWTRFTRGTFPRPERRGRFEVDGWEQVRFPNGAATNPRGMEASKTRGPAHGHVPAGRGVPGLHQPNDLRNQTDPKDNRKEERGRGDLGRIPMRWEGKEDGHDLRPRWRDILPMAEATDTKRKHRILGVLRRQSGSETLRDERGPGTRRAHHAGPVSKVQPAQNRQLSISKLVCTERSAWIGNGLTGDQRYRVLGKRRRKTSQSNLHQRRPQNRSSPVAGHTVQNRNRMAVQADPQGCHLGTVPGCGHTRGLQALLFWWVLDRHGCVSISTSEVPRRERTSLDFSYHGRRRHPSGRHRCPWQAPAKAEKDGTDVHPQASLCLCQQAC
eukprot:scaffold89_cov318-Pavlova_lutheri.AAC.4